MTYLKVLFSYVQFFLYKERKRNGIENPLLLRQNKLMSFVCKFCRVKVVLFFLWIFF